MKWHSCKFKFEVTFSFVLGVLFLSFVTMLEQMKSSYFIKPL